MKSYLNKKEEKEEEENNEQEEFEGEEIENDNNNNNTRPTPKYYRNNNLIHKGINQKRKLNRSSREENPLKSVAQKLRNEALKNNKKEKEKLEFDNDTSNDINNLEENEGYEDIGGIEDIQDLEQEENEEYDNNSKNKEKRIEKKEIAEKKQVSNDISNNYKERIRPREKHKNLLKQREELKKLEDNKIKNKKDEALKEKGKENNVNYITNKPYSYMGRKLNDRDNKNDTNIQQRTYLNRVINRNNMNTKQLSNFNQENRNNEIKTTKNSSISNISESNKLKSNNNPNQVRYNKYNNYINSKEQKALPQNNIYKTNYTNTYTNYKSMTNQRIKNTEEKNYKPNPQEKDNKSFKTFTYTSSKQDPLNPGSLIITSSKVRESKNSPNNERKIHHRISIRKSKSRSNSTSKNSNNRSITIIHSNEYIETDKDENNGEIIASDSNKKYLNKNRNTNIGRTYVTNFNIRNIDYVQTEGICYTDTEYVYLPLRCAQTICGLRCSVYQYYVGREGQSVAGVSMRKNILHILSLTEKILGHSTDEFEANANSTLIRDMYLSLFGQYLCEIYLLWLPYKQELEDRIDRVLQSIKKITPDIYKTIQEKSVYGIKYVKLWTKNRYVAFCILPFMRVYFNTKERILNHTQV